MIPAGYELSPLTARDAAALAAAHVRNRDHLAPWDPRRPASWDTTAGMAEVVGEQLVAVERGLLDPWVLWYGADAVGRINLANIVWGAMHGGTLGYWVDVGHLRRGLASAMVGFIVDRAREIGLHRLEAGTMVENVASQGVLRAQGFEQYGLVPQFLHIDGAWRDHVLFQRLLHDGPPRPRGLPAGR